MNNAKLVQIAMRLHKLRMWHIMQFNAGLCDSFTELLEAEYNMIYQVYVKQLAIQGRSK